jgi:hypothetical protein
MFLGFHPLTVALFFIFILIVGILSVNVYQINRRGKLEEIELNKVKEEEKKNKEKEFLKQAYFESFYIIWPNFRKKYLQLTDSEFKDEYTKCSNLIIEHMVMEFKVSRIEAEKMVKERFDICKFDLLKQQTL